MSDVIYSAQYYANNSELILACRNLRYLRDEWETLDPTYGLGTFWREWQPKVFLRGDLYTWPRDPTNVVKLDFRDLRLSDNSYDVVVYDPPYKLNGTPSHPDTRYGVGEYTRWQDRIELMKVGMKECIRVLKPKGYLLVKCMDQVVSGRKVWQTDIMTRVGEENGCWKVDRLDYLTRPREQPHSRQVHSRGNYSTMLVFQKQPC